MSALKRAKSKTLVSIIYVLPGSGAQQKHKGRLVPSVKPAFSNTCTVTRVHAELHVKSKQRQCHLQSASAALESSLLLANQSYWLMSCNEGMTVALIRASEQRGGGGEWRLSFWGLCLNLNCSETNGINSLLYVILAASLWRHGLRRLILLSCRFWGSIFNQNSCVQQNCIVLSWQVIQALLSSAHDILDYPATLKLHSVRKTGLSLP